MSLSKLKLEDIKPYAKIDPQEFKSLLFVLGCLYSNYHSLFTRVPLSNDHTTVCLWFRLCKRLTSFTISVVDTILLVSILIIRLLYLFIFRALNATLMHKTLSSTMSHCSLCCCGKQTHQDKNSFFFCKINVGHVLSGVCQSKRSWIFSLAIPVHDLKSEHLLFINRWSVRFRYFWPINSLRRPFHQLL